MIQFQHTITDPLGLHGNPAKELMVLSKEMDSQITVSFKGKSAKAESMLRVMSLGAVTGSVVTVTIEGGNEEESCRKVKEFFDNRL